MANGRGGYRPGAGRKPKVLLYEEQVTAVEEKMARMLPKLADKLFEMAMEGDIRATRYLMDRILGRVPMLGASPSTDRTMPYSEREFRSEVLEHNLNLCEDELRLGQRVEDMFESEGDDDEEQTDDGQVVAPGRTAPSPNNGVADCRSVPAGQARGNIDARDDGVDTPDSTTPRFMPSDGPNDPDRTWYYPS